MMQHVYVRVQVQYVLMCRRRKKGGTPLPKQNTTEAQETSDVVFTAADYRTRKAISTTEISGVR